MKRWEKYSKEQIQEFLKESNSYAELAEKCGYINARISGGEQIKTIKSMITSLNLDDSHIREEKWRKGNFDYTRFKYGNNLTPANLLEAIIALRGRYCEVCGNKLWQGKEIPLEIHHLDGDNLNNVLDNLQMICPNCHALTDNYRGKNNHKAKNPINEEKFVEVLKNSPNIRQALLKLGLVPKGGNYQRAKELILKYNIAIYS